jgi:hypothetical protein
MVNTFALACLSPPMIICSYSVFSITISFKWFLYK